MRSNGFYFQERIGLNGEVFRIVKLKTMRPVRGIDTTVTHLGNPRITPLGKILRRTKIDELPQLWNVLLGEMSFVGPRPDVPGYADELKGQERIILTVRPGITGPATIKYKNEEKLLAQQPDPVKYNNEIVFPDKVRINMEYIRNWTLVGDIRYIIQTVFN
jgi:lipopolysaccharide/colanic/teichoic acid biosynthesis glycosyltransferase